MDSSNIIDNCARMRYLLNESGPLINFVMWCLEEQSRIRSGSIGGLYAQKKKSTSLENDLPPFPKKERISQGKIGKRRGRLSAILESEQKAIDWENNGTILNQLFDEVLWAVINKPKDPDYCYDLGMTCGLMMGRRMERFVNTMSISFPGVSAKKKKARDNFKDIREILKEMKIKDLGKFRKDKQLRSIFFQRVNEKVKARLGYELSEQRIMTIARSGLKNSIS